MVLIPSLTAVKAPQDIKTTMSDAVVQKDVYTWYVLNSNQLQKKKSPLVR